MCCCPAFGQCWTWRWTEISILTRNPGSLWILLQPLGVEKGAFGHWLCRCEHCPELGVSPSRSSWGTWRWKLLCKDWHTLASWRSIANALKAQAKYDSWYLAWHFWTYPWTGGSFHTSGKSHVHWDSHQRLQLGSMETLFFPSDLQSPADVICQQLSTWKKLQEDAQVFITPSLLTVRSRQVFLKAWWEMITRNVLGKSLSGRQTQNLHSVAWQKDKRQSKLKKRISEDMRKNIFTMKAAKNWNRLLRSCAVPIPAIFQDKTSCEQPDLIP